MEWIEKNWKANKRKPFTKKSDNRTVHFMDICMCVIRLTIIFFLMLLFWFRSSRSIQANLADSSICYARIVIGVRVWIIHLWIHLSLCDVFFCLFHVINIQFYSKEVAHPIQREKNVVIESECESHETISGTIFCCCCKHNFTHTKRYDSMLKDFNFKSCMPTTLGMEKKKVKQNKTKDLKWMNNEKACKQEREWKRRDEREREINKHRIQNNIDDSCP